MIYVVKINDKEYEVEVEKGQANILRTTDVVVSAPALAPQPTVAPVSVKTAPVSAVEGHLVKSPMPGTILEIKVQPGMRVNKGEILLVLEAMKMENEIAAPVSGVVGQVLTTKGASVATDDMLITIQ